jgi:xanthine dehydrogenase molybdopterin-binding subunit B
VAACDLETARKAAMAAIIEYEDLEPVLDVVQALRNQHFVLDSHTHQRGDSARRWPTPNIGCRARCISAGRNTSTWKPKSHR